MKLVFAVLLAVCVLFSGATASEDTSRAVRELAESLISSGQVVGTIQAAHAVVPIAELGASFVAIAETEDPVPLDLKYREPCKAGHACPIKNGHCCLNGTMCCPAGQPCQPTNPPTCGTSAMEKALLVAKAKIQQEVHLTTDEEQKAKKKSEAGKKAEIEGKEKARQERKDKRAKEHKEKNDAIIAAKNAQIEKMKQLAAAHAAKQADQRTKHKLKLAERSEKRKDKEEKGKEQRKKAEANKKAEARTKEARKKAEQASKESKTKSQEKARKKAAENRKKAANRIRLVHGFRAYGGSYRAPSVQRVGQFCFVSGLLRLGRYNTYVGRLPAKCRPQRRLLFKVNFGSGRRARLDVLKNGYMYWLKHDAGTSWLPLDGIQFSVTRGSTLRLGRHWRHYGYSYDHAQVRKEGNFCMVQGLVRWANYRWSTRAVAYLPKWCRPDRRLIFSAQHWGEQIRIDVLRDGRMYWIYKRTNTVWLSLAGINFFTKPGTQIRYANGWRAYGYYRTPSVYKQGKICSLSGLARSQYNRWGHMGYVPVACRPKKRLIFYGNNHGGHYREGRVDILPNGAIVWITGGRSHRWLSLSFNWLIY